MSKLSYSLSVVMSGVVIFGHRTLTDSGGRMTGRAFWLRLTMMLHAGAFFAWVAVISLLLHW